MSKLQCLYPMFKLIVGHVIIIPVINEPLTIIPVINEPLTLEERLADFDPVRHGGEVMLAEQKLGAEQW